MTPDKVGAIGDLGWASLAEVFTPGSALVAVVSGPSHDVVYSNDAYADEFGPAQHLADAALVALVEDVYTTGKPSTLAGGGPNTFVCTPLRDEQRQVAGVLVLGVEAEVASGPERQTALTLQRSLLPQVLHRPDELDVAVRYHPGPDELLGGDWYDIVPLGAGRTGIVIGDVRGRGVHAAAVMGQLRAAVRAYARLDLPPAEILELLDGLVAEMGGTGPVSCCYAVFDPVESAFTCASAGHPPPFLIGADGLVAPLPMVTTSPLGSHGAAFTELAFALPEGATLVLYTDGLTERPGSDPADGVQRLAGALARSVGTVEERCAGVLAEMIPGGAHDDVALMLVDRRPPVPIAGVPRARTIELTLSEGQEPTRRARAFCHGALSMWRVPEPQQEDIILVVSELVTNAILHGEAAKQLRLRRTPLRVVVEVFDNGRRMPHPRLADLEAESGRGLHLVSRLADRWGARPVHGGKVVWCEFDIPLG